MLTRFRDERHYSITQLLEYMREKDGVSFIKINHKIRLTYSYSISVEKKTFILDSSFPTDLYLIAQLYVVGKHLLSTI